MKYKEELINIRIVHNKIKLYSFLYRYDSVPFIHKQSQYYINNRQINTTQERRLSESHLLEGIKIRGKRKPKSLPNNRDKWYRSRHFSKSWKDNKKRKQYVK